MHETPEELEVLQQLLDESYRTAGEHLLSIHTPKRRLRAHEVSEELRGTMMVNLATVNSRGEPMVAPVDGMFLGGTVWFGSSHQSMRFRHIRRNPNVSLAYNNGEAISILVHGVAHEVDTASGDYERLHEYCRELYGANYDDMGYWGKAPFAWIEARRFYALKISA